MENEPNVQQEIISNNQRIFVVLLAIGISTLIALLIPDYANDFTCFYNAGSALASLQSPYTVDCFYSPVWVALFFSPFSIFSREVAYRIYAAILFSSYLFIIWKISKKINKQDLYIPLIASFSPFVYMTMQYGNIDWLVLLGLITPKFLGIWLILSKPQMGFTLAMVWGWIIFKEQGVKALILTFAPVTLGVLVSILAGMRLPNPGALSSWSADVWPYGLIIGIPALFVGFKKKDEYLSLATAPFLTPYIGPMSWAAILPFAMKNRKYIMVAVMLSWLLVIIWRLKL